jgi:succinate dehydrogenase/fumarate reductase flavoprotein subunit
MWEEVMADGKVVVIETDVLVIGGGLAGCMAAIKAGEQDGLRVTLVDKSNTVRSGCTASGIDHLWGYIPPIHEKMGYTLDDMAEDHRQGIARGFFRRDLFDLVAGSMYERMLDLEKFGINFRYEDSKVPGKFRIVDQFHSVPASFNFDGESLKPKLTKEAKRRGVNIINRVQMTDLISTNGQISGAVGIGTRTADIYLFKAKAVVLSAGRSNRLSRNPTGFDFNTRIPSPMSGDGTSMAIRAELPIINAEFFGGEKPAACGNYNPNYGDPRNTVQPAARVTDGQGNVIIPRTQFYDWDSLGKTKWTEKTRQEWLGKPFTSPHHGATSFVPLSVRLKRGEGPFYLDFSEATDYEKEYISWSIKNEGKGTQFMRYFTEEENADLRRNPQEYSGFWPREMAGTSAKGMWVDKDLETDLKNLFGAGDEVGGLPWQAGAGAVTQGWHAGAMAAKRAAAQKSLLPVSEEVMKARQRLCSEILSSKDGFYWKEVETYVQNVMGFYCGDVRGGGLLRRGLERLEDAKAAPMKAENPHELGRAMDVKSIIDNAELVLRSSLERKESRPTFDYRRAEYPEPDDMRWFCFLAIRRVDGKFEFSKKPFKP